MPRANRQESLARDNARAALRSRTDRDIAPGYPSAGDLERRESCEKDLKRFFKTYFPAAFALEWSSDHLRGIARMEEAILEGGLFALAAPRGDGKTTRAVRAALWALLYGHRRFVSLLGATEKHASKLLKHVKTELTTNDELIRDFRQVCYPFVRLEGHARKAAGQLWDGVPTRIEWGADRLVFPTLPPEALDGADVGGSTVSVAGLTGALRGQSAMLSSGEIIRPELVLLDDPQTRESANSAAQSEDRLAIVNGDVLGMAGPGRKITAVACVTVIRAEDMADVLLDRKRSPRWRGEKCKLMLAFPSNMKLWETYAGLRRSSMERGGNGAEATEFYRQRQAEMDEGAVAAWPQRYLEDEISAVQHAMNLKIDDEASFMAEYQNDPVIAEQADSPVLSPALIARKTSGVRRGELPIRAEIVTGFVDVHDSILYWGACGWSPAFDGWCCDYGTWPEQPLRHFAMRKAPRTLAERYPGTGREGAIRAGLADLTDRLASREWRREDGAVMRAGRILIDAGYVPDVVYDVCRHSPHAAVLMPSRGVGIGAKGKPVSEFDHARGDHVGHYWWVPKATDRRAQRHFRFDSNYWKSFVHSRLAVALGDPGCLSLFGHDPEEHRLIADHLTAEFAVQTSGHGRSLFEWSPRPGRPDNHYFDVLVGNAAAASFGGAVLAGLAATTSPVARVKRVSFADLQRQRRA